MGINSANRAKKKYFRFWVVIPKLQTAFAHKILYCSTFFHIFGAL